MTLALKAKVCTSNELRDMLIDGGWGSSVVRKSLSFLTSGKCGKIDILVSEGKPVGFAKQGKVISAKGVPRKVVLAKVQSLLTKLQGEILQKLEKHHKTIYYFSLYELKKLLPYAGNSVDYAVMKLSKLRLVEPVTIADTQFYTKPKNVGRLELEANKATVDVKTEFAVINRVHELIMNLYPRRLVTDFRNAIRPSSPEVLKKTGGMTFDIFYQFKEPIGKRVFMAIDVFTRVPVNGHVVYSFMNKISWAKTRRRGESQVDYNLKDKTFGMIVFRRANQKAIDLANDNGISFLRLPDIKVDFNEMRAQILASLDSKKD